MPGDTAQNPALPLGQEEPGRAQDSEDAPATGRFRALQISTPCTGSIQPIADWELRYLLLELTLGLESWLPPVFLFLPVSPCA